jgi:hypothetical protein
VTPGWRPVSGRRGFPDRSVRSTGWAGKRGPNGGGCPEARSPRVPRTSP